MDANAVQVLQLRGGDLTRLKGSKWVFCRGADVVLPERFLAFLAERVKCVDAALDAAHFAVKAVDKALPDGRGSDDLWAASAGAALARRATSGLSTSSLSASVASAVP